MKRSKLKIVSMLLITIITILIGINTYAHSGRTDSNGGHKDNKNSSGLGSYHYHCGGHEAHLHNNGVCPYSSSSKSSSSSSNSKSSSTSSNSTTTSKPVNIVATQIQINENIENIEIGTTKTLTATITPNNVTDKNIIWKSSDESIATVSSIGEITPKKPGIVDITATTSNNKKNSIKISIKEEPKEEVKVENTAIIKTSAISREYSANNKKINDKKDLTILGAILIVGLISGGSYLVYKKCSKYKK